MLSNSYFILFSVIALGLALGRVSLKGVSLGASGVIFVAMLLGHFGATIPADFQKVGLLLFIFTIGIQAGPSFFQSFVEKGKKLIVLAAALVLIASLSTAILSFAFGVDMNIAVGLLSGALTSTPGLAAAIESTGSPLASLGYGIAYPFGVIGVILFGKLAPTIFKLDFKKAEKEYEAEGKESFPDIRNANFEVTNPNIFGKSLAKLRLRNLTQATISRVKKNNEVQLATRDMVLEKGDVIKAVGTEDALEKVKLFVGEESEEKLDLKNQIKVEWVLVSNKAVVNKTIRQLNLQDNYAATITRINRSGVQISPKGSTSIRYGDRLLIATSGYKENVIRLFGNDNKKLSETDFLPIALGILIGIGVGLVPIPLPGGIEFKLGLTGGVLFSALLLSWKGKTGPITWSLSGAGNQLLRQLGLLLFLAPIGTSAGAQLMQTIQEQGMGLFAIAAAITLVPMFVTAIVGLYVLKVNPLTLLGLIMGSMTSTPGLSALDNTTESEAPQIAYATVYPVAMVLLIICTQILSLI